MHKEIKTRNHVFERENFMSLNDLWITKFKSY